MLKTITSSQYPRLYELLFSIAHDGGAINRLEDVKFVLPDTYDFSKMEHTLNKLSSEDFELFIYGEDDEVTKLIGRFPALNEVDIMIYTDWVDKF